MPDIPYPNTIRVLCHQSFYGEESSNVWHVRTTTADELEEADATALADAFAAFYNNISTLTTPNRGIRDYRAQQALFDRISVYDLRTVPNPAVQERTYSVLGNGTNQGVPLDCAGVITLRTAIGGRSGRGRIYLGPLTNVLSAPSSTEPSNLTATFRQDVLDAVSDLDDRIQALAAPGPYRLAVLSVADGVSRQVTRAVMDSRPDTQRRRDLSAPFPAPLSLTIT